MGENGCDDAYLYEDEAKIAFQVYPFTSGFSFLITFGLFMLYLCNKRLRIHPNGIIIHLLFTLSVFSLVTFIDGLIFLLTYHMLFTS